MRDASQAASAFTPQERTSVPYSIVRIVRIVRTRLQPRCLSPTQPIGLETAFRWALDPQ